MVKDAAGGTWQLTAFCSEFSDRTSGEMMIYPIWRFLAYFCSNGWGKKPATRRWMLNVHEVSMFYFKEVVKIHHIHSTLVSRCACVVFLNPRLGLREKVLTIQLTKFTDIFEQQQQVPSRQIWFSWLNIRLLINLFFFAIPSIKPLVATQTLLYIHPEKFEEDESPILTCAYFFCLKNGLVQTNHQQGYQPTEVWRIHPCFLD